MRLYNVEWSCKLCGHLQSFRHGLSEMDDWPNKFEDMECENQDCGQIQDVPTRSCTINQIN